MIGPLNGSPNRLSYGVSHQNFCLEYFASNSSIQWNPPTNFHPNLIATISQMSLLQFCVLLSQQSHLFLNGEVLMCNDSTRDHRRHCQISKIVRVNDFWFPGRSQERLLALVSFPRSFCFARVRLNPLRS